MNRSGAEIPSEEQRLSDVEVGEHAHRLYEKAMSSLRNSRPFLEQHFDRYLGKTTIGSQNFELLAGDINLKVTIERDGPPEFRLKIEKWESRKIEKISLKSDRVLREGKLVDVGEVEYQTHPLERPADTSYFGETHEGTQIAVERVEGFLGELQELLS
ncbi:hypothetical protein IH980_04375 [Patescibacteria group bacterium]|nr:hypothetical protein [Patescibacteria group bacterium]